MAKKKSLDDAELEELITLDQQQEKSELQAEMDSEAFKKKYKYLEKKIIEGDYNFSDPVNTLHALLCPELTEEYIENYRKLFESFKDRVGDLFLITNNKELDEGWNNSFEYYVGELASDEITLTGYKLTIPTKRHARRTSKNITYGTGEQWVAKNGELSIDMSRHPSNGFQFIFWGDEIADYFKSTKDDTIVLNTTYVDMLEALNWGSEIPEDFQNQWVNELNDKKWEFYEQYIRPNLLTLTPTAMTSDMNHNEQQAAYAQNKTNAGLLAKAVEADVHTLDRIDDSLPGGQIHVGRAIIELALQYEDVPKHLYLAEATRFGVEYA